MRILTWNICHGGGDHKAIASAIAAHSADVIVLSEHQTEKSQSLIEQLRLSGWPHMVSSPTEGAAECRGNARKGTHHRPTTNPLR